jgi:hypothetical protein
LRLARQDDRPLQHREPRRADIDRDLPAGPLLEAGDFLKAK